MCPPHQLFSLKILITSSRISLRETQSVKLHHCSLHTKHCILHTTHCIMHISHCILHTTHLTPILTMHTAHCTLFKVGSVQILQQHCSSCVRVLRLHLSLINSICCLAFHLFEGSIDRLNSLNTIWPFFGRVSTNYMLPVYT